MNLNFIERMIEVFYSKLIVDKDRVHYLARLVLIVITILFSCLFIINDKIAMVKELIPIMKSINPTHTEPIDQPASPYISLK